MNDDDKMDALLRQMAAEEYNRPPQIVPRETMWEAIQSGIGNGQSGIGGAAGPDSGARNVRPILNVVPRWVYFAAAAVLLLAVGIQVGRRLGPTRQDIARAPAAAAPSRPDSSGAATTDTARVRPSAPLAPNEQRVAQVPRTDDSGKRPPTPKGGPERSLDANGDDARARAYSVAAAQHLTEAEAMLTAFKGDLSQGRMDTEISAWGKELLSNTRLLLDSPAASDPTRRKLLQDLELVLVQIVQLSPKSSSRDRDLIKGALTDDQVLTRLRTAIPVKGT